LVQEERFHMFIHHHKNAFFDATLKKENDQITLISREQQPYKNKDIKRNIPIYSCGVKIGSPLPEVTGLTCAEFAWESQSFSARSDIFYGSNPIKYP